MKTGDYRLPRHTVLMAHNLLISAVLMRIVALTRSPFLSRPMVSHTSELTPRFRKLIVTLLRVGGASWQSAVLFSPRERLLEELRESADLRRCSTLQHGDHRGERVV